MRKIAAALAFALVVSLGIAVPSVGAAVGDPKVVMIVGATHDATAGYRADADRAYAEAIKYTSNVVKVYSPYATWAKVQEAVVGASVVIYMGHGNGWPSPYTYDPTYATKDGFGLNATYNAGDYNNKYYGEPSIATLRLAPGAIILLHHLCYASGNSEPGNAEPTVTVARQRADNYAAGFFKAGASAVIADGHSGAERYLHDLFTTHKTIDAMWREQSNAKGNFVSFASARTPGATVSQDPMTPTSGFYRSVAIRTPGITTDEVVSAGYGDTGVNPTNLVVPGNAEVVTDGAPLYGDISAADTSSTVPAGTRLRVVGDPNRVTEDGGRLVAVAGIDDTSIAGFMLASDLAPRDSIAPAVRAIDVGAGRFSPNGDGQGDSEVISGRFTETAAWTFKVRNGGGDTLYQSTGTGSTFSAAWDGIVGGDPVPDGSYTVAISATDAWGNGPVSTTRIVTVDTVAPTLTALTPDATQWFSPNGDGVGDSVSVTGTNSEAGSLAASVTDATGGLVNTWTTSNGSAPAGITWNGRTTAGASVPDGVYTMHVAPVDAAGNTGEVRDRTVRLISGLRSVLTSTGFFFPHDGDSLAKSTKLQFTLARPMTVSWTIRNAGGATVITKFPPALRAAGTYYWIFDGRRPDGSRLPRGRYTSFVTASDGELVATQSVWFEEDAFTIKPSDTTPGRGQSITISITSAEPLARPPTLWVNQPGVRAWSARTSRTGTYTYKVTIRLKTRGRTGSVSLKVWGVDSKRGTQATTRVFALH